MNESKSERVAQNTLTLFAAIMAAKAIKATTSEEYRHRLKRRSQLREELSAPDWFPHQLKPYYNIVGWRGRLAYFVGQASLRTSINWHRYAVLDRLASWSLHVDIRTRWEAHDDWPCP